MLFERLNLEHGLSQSVVYCISQDAAGFMWFGTQEGLNKYDGYNFKIYQNDSCDIKNADFHAIGRLLKDSSDNLWIVSNSDYLFRHDNVTDKMISFGLDKENEIISIVNSLTEDQDGDLLLGTASKGILRFDKKNNSSEYLTLKMDTDDPRYSSRITDVCSDGENIWFSSDKNRLCLYNKNNSSLIYYPINNSSKAADSNVYIFLIYKFSDEVLWIGTNSGLKVFDINKKKFSDFKFNSITDEILSKAFIKSVCKDKNDNYWIGTHYSGIVFIDFKNHRAENFLYVENDLSSLSNSTINCIYNDSSNVIWIGTRGGGISRTDCEAKKYCHVKSLQDKQNDTGCNIFMCFGEDKNKNLWAGGYGGGLFKVSNGEVTNYTDIPGSDETLKGDSVISIAARGNKEIWVGTMTNILNKLSLNENKFSHYEIPGGKDNTIFSIKYDLKHPEKLIWLGTSRAGLLKFDIKKNECESVASAKTDKFNIRSDFIRCMCFDSAGNLWIGTHGAGLCKIDFKNGSVISYYGESDEEKFINDKIIFALTEDTNFNVWVGTNSKGLYKFDNVTQTFRKYSTENGLPNNSIQGILEDTEGNIWISSSNGLSKFNPEKEKFKNFDSFDGLQSNEFNQGACFKNQRGLFYFGGINGYNYFLPREIKDNPYIPKVAITDFQIFNESVVSSPDNPFLKKSITVTDEINLSYKESVISFEFAALIYNNSRKNQYAYCMEGFDKDWVYCGTRRNTTYTNLDPGEYTFRVKGSNNDGVWNEEGTEIKINITPPYWKTWWFKGLGLLSLISATGITYKQRLNKIEEKRKEQENFSRKLLKSQETERKKLASELHDSIAQDILILKNNAVLGLQDAGGNEKYQEVLNSISELSSSTLNDVRNIAHNLHPHLIEALGLTKAIKSISDRAAKSTDINFVTEADIIDNIFTEENEVYLFRIIQESINNIIKHSSASEAVISITHEEDSIGITISDNGKGFSLSSNVNRNSLGLSGISERVKMLNGSMNLESEKGKGTLLNISIPVKLKNKK